jgi:hypothetical protein
MLAPGARMGLAAAAVLSSISGIACSSGPDPIALKNKVFYQYDATNAARIKELEAPYPPLDKTEASPLPRYMGVSLLGGAVHLSRPNDWVIRVGNTQAEHRYIEYVSPKEYMVAVYELAESPLDPWRELMGRYEEQAKKSGADFVGQRVPMATSNAQGRGYLVRRAVAAAKAPLVNYANEYLLRSENRVVLVQIVHHEQNLAPMDEELRRVVETLEVN